MSSPEAPAHISPLEMAGAAQRGKPVDGPTREYDEDDIGIALGYLPCDEPNPEFPSLSSRTSPGCFSVSSENTTRVDMLSGELTKFSPRLSPSVGEISSRNLYFLQYYIECLCPVLVMIDMPTNPLRILLPQSALSSSMLLQAVCAVSACHMAQRTVSVASNYTQVELDAVRYYTRAIDQLNTSLPCYSTAHCCLSDEILLTTVFLCKYEIVRGSTNLWRQHLMGLERLLNIQQRANRRDTTAEAFVQGL